MSNVDVSLPRLPLPEQTWYRRLQAGRHPFETPRMVPALSRFGPDRVFSADMYELLYLSDAPETAQNEIMAHFSGGAAISLRNEHYATYPIRVRLQALSDLSDETTLRLLSLDLVDILGENYGLTHRLGAQLFSMPQLEGFVYPSRYSTTGRNLVVFPEKLLPGSSLTFLDESVEREYQLTSRQAPLHVLYVDPAGRMHYLPAARGPDGTIVLHGSDLEKVMVSSAIRIQAVEVAARIEEFEYLINKADVKESDLQKFFERNPDFLLGHEYERLFPQVVLVREGQENLKPDFLLKPLAGVSYPAKIVDLKLPAKPVFLAKPRREGLYAAVNEAIAQLRTYSRYFEDPQNRDYVKKELGFTAYRPRLAVVIGRAVDVDDESVYQDILREALPVELVTYEDLLRQYRRRHGLL